TPRHPRSIPGPAAGRCRWSVPRSGLVRLADPVVALETRRAGRIADGGSARRPALCLVVGLADAVVAFLAAGADRVAGRGVGVLDVRLADAVVALLARGAGGRADLAVLELHLDLAQLGHARLVGAVVAVLDLDIDEGIVAPVVHLHPGVGVVDLHREMSGLRERRPARLDLHALDPALVLRFRLAKRDLGILRERSRGNRQGGRACL